MAQIGAQFVQAVQPVPVGSLQPYAGANAPTGWLLCDGGSYSTTLYPDLYSVLGYTYGGSGASFNVPDLRGRVPMGAGTGAQNGGSGTGVISGGTALTARTRGAFGGDERLATHNHGVTDPGHTHGHYEEFGNSNVNTGPGGSYSTHGGYGPYYGRNTTNTTGISIQNNVGGGSGGNMPPFLVTNYIIKALPDVPRQGMALGTTPPIVTALPVNPQFGEVVTYAADATNGVYWNLQYDASGTYPWKFIGGAALESSVGGTWSSPSIGPTSTYVQTLSGSPSITAPLAGTYRSEATANGKPSNTSPSPGIFISYNGSAPGSWDGADSLGGNASAVLSAVKSGTLTSSGQVINLRYLNSNIGGTVSFWNVVLRATPVRVA